MSRLTRRYADLKVLYDTDIEGRSLVIRQRTYKTQGGEAETPITSLLLARVVPGDCPAPRRSLLSPRRAIACFANPSNVNGQTELAAISPYRPTDPQLKAHVLEVRAVNDVLAVRYQGEGFGDELARNL